MWYTRLQLFAECVYTRLKLRKPAYTRVHLVQLAYIRFCNPEKERIWSLSRKKKKNTDWKTGKAWSSRKDQTVRANKQRGWALIGLRTTQTRNNKSVVPSGVANSGWRESTPRVLWAKTLPDWKLLIQRNTHTQPSFLLLSKF